MSTEEALKRCWSCGGRGAVIKSWVPRSRERVACCADETCIGHMQEQDEQGGWGVSFITDAEAIAAWNRRAPSGEPCHADALLELANPSNGKDR